MAVIDLRYRSKSRPLIEKNHQKSGNDPIFMKFSEFIYQSQNKNISFFTLDLNKCTYKINTIDLIDVFFKDYKTIETNNVYLLNVSMKCFSNVLSLSFLFR